MGNMEYNSAREDLIIPEYGRNIQKMIDHALSVEDKEERSKIAKAIISVMGQSFPHLRDIDDWTHKLWDHLQIMSDFKLDVDSPYDKPEPQQFEEKPDRVPYPQSKIRYGHYGKTLEDLIQKTCEYPDGDEKNVLTLICANIMKKHYLTWNRDSVSDELIISQLSELSNGKLQLSPETQLVSTKDIMSKMRKKNPLPKKSHQKKNYGKKKRW